MFFFSVSHWATLSGGAVHKRSSGFSMGKNTHKKMLTVKLAFCPEFNLRITLLICPTTCTHRDREYIDMYCISKLNIYAKSSVPLNLHWILHLCSKVFIRTMTEPKTYVTCLYGQPKPNQCMLPRTSKRPQSLVLPAQLPVALPGGACGRWVVVNGTMWGNPTLLLNGQNG